MNGLTIMEIKKVILFFLICIFYQNVGYTQLAMSTMFEAALKDLDPDILHERKSIEKITWCSYSSNNQENKTIDTYMTFDSLGRKLETAYFSKFSKDVSIPYKIDIKSYGKNFCKEVVVQNFPEGIDTVRVTKSYYRNGILQSEDILKKYQSRITTNKVLKIKKNKKEHQIFYKYDIS
ncbi:MAG: hypothetical protein ACI85O_003350 [Saprospiraceae bacterium]|jgi:hypothetical protein